MFLTMKSFLIFFFVMLALIVLGILFEEYLIAFENAVWKTVRDFIRTRKERVK